MKTPRRKRRKIQMSGQKEVRRIPKMKEKAGTKEEKEDALLKRPGNPSKVLQMQKSGVLSSALRNLGDLWKGKCMAVCLFDIISSFI